MKQANQLKSRLPVFTERFRELQEDRSNTEFAEFLGISRQTVGFYCNGDRIPDALGLKEVAEKCEVSTDWLLGLSDFRTKEDCRGANEFYTEFMHLMASEHDEFDRKRVTAFLTEVLHGFQYSLSDYFVGYTQFEALAKVIAGVLSSTASCIKVAVDSSDRIDDQDEADELFKRIGRILEGSSIAVYKQFGVYFNSIRTLAMDYLKANDYREMSFEFCSAAEKLLKESDEEYTLHLLNEAEAFSEGGKHNGQHSGTP